MQFSLLLPLQAHFDARRERQPGEPSWPPIPSSSSGARRFAVTRFGALARAL
ncbi:hypothetical protein [Burkholderia sp. WAC0059]|uniref:hypothetical protein n=1 Tax=Burkholderia sp. WAC0059 TaxID=2066022 RepID=UPI0015E1470F|nr:hypothetical protein [Burkholderia sp. WAC0059]